MSPRAGGRGRGLRAAALVVVLLTAGCGDGAGAATSPGGADPLPPGPLLQPADLTELLPGLSGDASLRPLWQVWGDDQWELRVLRAECGAVTDPPATLDGAGAAEHDAEQWLQGTAPQYASLDVLRWPGGEPDGPRHWVDGAVAAEATCREAVVLPEQPGAGGGPSVTPVVRPWEVPHSGGGPGTRPLPQCWVGDCAVDGSTALAARTARRAAAPAPSSSS